MSSLSLAQQLALALLPKITGWTSVLFSTLVATTILRDPRRRSLVYHRLICGISLVDASASLWLGLSTWPIPADTGVLWAVGNDTTCRVQGFFTQFGISSSFYNTSLSIYFWLVIVRGWKEARLAQWEPLLHAIPVAWAVVSAVTGLVLDVYGSAVLWCWVSSAEQVFRWTAFYGPLWLMILLVTMICVVIFAHVWRLERASQKHRLFHSPSAALAAVVLEEPPPSLDQQEEEEASQEATSIVVGGGHSDNTEAAAPRQLQSISSQRSTSLRAFRSSRFLTQQSTANSGISTNRSSIQRRNYNIYRRSQRVKDVSQQCFLYAGAFYINWAALTVTRLIQTVNQDKVYYPLVLIAAITVPLQGLPNFVIYVMPKIRRQRKNDPQAKWYNLLMRSLGRESGTPAPAGGGSGSKARQQNQRCRRQGGNHSSDSLPDVLNPSEINDDDNDMDGNLDNALESVLKEQAETQDPIRETDDAGTPT